MDNLRITLSDAESALLDEQAATQGHANAEDYATAVIRAELKVKAQEKLEALLLEGLEGEATEWTEADSQELLRLATEGN